LQADDADNHEKLADHKVDETSQTRRNPFTGTDEQSTTEEESSFKAMFIVRFLGCKRVNQKLMLKPKT